MQRFFLNILPIAALLFIASCGENHDSISDAYGVERQLDSLIDNGANPYDIASFLYENPEYLDVPVVSSPDGDYTVQTSSDGNFRVYSIYDWPSSSVCEIHNIFQYRTGGYDDTIYLKADAGDSGSIKEIGKVSKGDKALYILVSDNYILHHGVYYTAMVSVYSLNDYMYDSLARESVFVTNSGQRLDYIEVFWQDEHWEKDDSNLFGVAIDNKEDTREIYIQVIDANTGDALDRAIVYAWDGESFVYAGIRAMSICRDLE